MNSDLPLAEIVEMYTQTHPVVIANQTSLKCYIFDILKKQQPQNPQNNNKQQPKKTQS